MAGHLRKGALLPPEPELCRTFAVSTITMRRALMELTRDGFIRRQSGVGTFVASETKKIKFALLFLGFDSAEWLLRSDIFGHLLGGIGDAAWHARADFSTTRVAADEDATPILKMLADEGQVDGILLRAAGDIEDSHLTLLESRHMPYVVIKRNIDGRRMNFVTMDDTNAALAVTSHLIQMGHHRIGLISGAQDISPRRAIYQGYCRALEQHGLPYDARLVHFTSALPAEDDGYWSMQKLLAEEQRPTAVFAAGDALAIGAMDAIVQACLQVPNDVAIVGYGDTQAARAARPSLTTISTPYDEIGRLAADTLFDLISHPDGGSREIFIEAPLIVRASSVLRSGVNFSDQALIS